MDGAGAPNERWGKKRSAATKSLGYSLARISTICFQEQWRVGAGRWMGLVLQTNVGEKRIYHAWAQQAWEKERRDQESWL